MRADAVNVEHRLRRLIAVRFHPCDHRSVNVCDLTVTPLVGTAGDRNLRKRTELYIPKVV